MKEKILVIGGCGFIGRNLIPLLIEKKFTVSVVDRNKESWLPNCVEFYQTSFTESSIELENAFSNVDVVYHLASTTLPKSSNDDPIFDVHSNLEGTINLLNLAIKNKVTKFIFASSGGTVYGTSNAGLVTESSSTEPICSYGIVKLAIEKYLSLYSMEYGISTCSMRISNPYGPKQDINRSQGVIPIFINKALNNETIEIWGDGSVSRDFIYISDLIDAMYLLIGADFVNEVINVSSASAVSLNEITSLIKEASGKNMSINYKDSREFDVPYTCLDNKKAELLLGWKPNVSIKEGITMLMDEMSKS